MTETSGTSDVARVLAAEKAAEARIAEARAAAERTRHGAVQAERRIAERMDTRVRALHAGMDRAIDAEKARLAAAFETEQREIGVPAPDRDIKAAAARLARVLVGLPPE